MQPGSESHACNIIGPCCISHSLLICTLEESKSTLDPLFVNLHVYLMNIVYNTLYSPCLPKRIGVHSIINVILHDIPLQVTPRSQGSSDSLRLSASTNSAGQQSTRSHHGVRLEPLNPEIVSNLL